MSPLFGSNEALAPSSMLHPVAFPRSPPFRPCAHSYLTWPDAAQAHPTPQHRQLTRQHRHAQLSQLLRSITSAPTSSRLVSVVSVVPVVLLVRPVLRAVDALRVASFVFRRLSAVTHRPQRSCSSLVASSLFLIASHVLLLFAAPPTILLIFPMRTIYVSTVPRPPSVRLTRMLTRDCSQTNGGANSMGVSEGAILTFGAS
ncbi:hypothetical protein B0H13DRAFT_2456833 [Mycena leptocephala]|nr:hypothetical protein B0H13DRAFT_2456833 [Mycena leptocephala]